MLCCYSGSNTPGASRSHALTGCGHKQSSKTEKTTPGMVKTPSLNVTHFLQTILKNGIVLQTGGRRCTCFSFLRSLFVVHPWNRSTITSPSFCSTIGGGCLQPYLLNHTRQNCVWFSFRYFKSDIRQDNCQAGHEIIFNCQAPACPASGA